MAKQDFSAKSISELRTLAKKAGVTAERTWKKADFVEALSKKTDIKKKPAKVKSTASAVKAAPVLKAQVKTAKHLSKVPAAKKAVPSSAPVKSVKKGRIDPRIKDEIMPPLLPINEAELPPLPEECGENRVVTMTVTPKRLYVYWEVSGEIMAQHSGNLNLKVIATKTGKPFYLPISERIGEYFITVNPDTEYVAEVGVIDKKGEFVAMAMTRHEESRASMTAQSRPEIAQPDTNRALNTGIPSPSVAGEQPAIKHAGESLPDEFFGIPEMVSSAASGLYPPYEDTEGGLPEEFFKMPESISSY